MVANDDFDGKATHLNGFYMHMIFEQKYPKPAIVYYRRVNLQLPHFFFVDWPIKEKLCLFLKVI